MAGLTLIRLYQPGLSFTGNSEQPHNHLVSRNAKAGPVGGPEVERSKAK